MNYLMLPMLLLMTFAAAAEEKKIYKYTDENGVTHYSETKLNDNYHEADLPPLSIVPSTPVENRSQSVSQQDDEEEASAEAELTIVQPAHEENLWGTGGKVTAQVNEINVALMEANQVQFIIDGKKQPPADGLTQVFDGIFRGEHTLKARVINKYNKKVIKESKTITFYMHQNSKK